MISSNKIPQPSLLIISDLWGIESSTWWQYYTSVLKEKFDIIELDSQVLAKVPNEFKDEKDIHRYFVEVGIFNAVNKLSQAPLKVDAILAFSIGGTIAWQSLLKNQNSPSLFAISSTRLRNETLKPNAKIYLFYGKEDIFQPEKKWFEQQHIAPIIFKEEQHDFYMKQEYAQSICKMILEEVVNKR
ncbi:MAG: hypothetical protein M9958_05150 [Chitinophagales bacterium]|nr:hypothetical protein [Chitinophagales bacterium]